jgi:hypothetical protein
MNRHGYIIPFSDIQKAGLFNLELGEFVKDASIQMGPEGSLLCLSVEYSEELAEFQKQVD